MKPRFLTIIFFLLFANIVVGQDCPSGNLFFTTQTEIDEFLMDFPNCTEFEQNVEVSNFNNDIVNLLGFQNIVSVGGSLRIQNNSALISLAGLNNLESVSGTLRLMNSMNLSSLADLNNLIYVGGLTIDNCQGLINFEGLEILTSIDGYLNIENNQNLVSLSGLDNITFNQIDMSEVSNSLYMIEIKTDKGAWIERLVKVKN